MSRASLPALRPWAAAGLLAAAALWAYRNTVAVPFLFDDHRHIVHHAAIRSLAGSLADTTRPAVDLSVALNYAIGGLDVSGYHAFNLLIHILAGVALYGCLRRTFRGPKLADGCGEAADGLALAAALLWLVHPLQTQSVTYVIQRAESMAGLCVLVSLYAAIRGMETPGFGWAALSAAACAAGVASKPVAVMAPVAILLYDRAFRSLSFAHALRAHRGLYAALASTWGLFLALQAREFGHPEPTAGFGYRGVTPLGYAFTQPSIILHYLRLSLWPSPLVFDYLWPVARAGQLPGPWLGIAGLLGLTGWAWRRHPPLGFLGAWWFLFLAPTSTFIPVADLAAEHRVYLPLAAVAALAAVGGRALLRRTLPSLAAAQRVLGFCAAAAAAILLGAATIRRNEDYRSERALWSDVLAKRPDHFRALSSLGDVARREGNLEESVAYFSRARDLLPDNPEACDNLGQALVRAGRLAEGISQYEAALRLKPDDARAHNHLGTALLHAGRREEAIGHFEAAVRLEPKDPDARFNFANALVGAGRLDEAAAQYAESLRLQPDYADYIDAHITLGNILAQQDRPDEASAHYRAALRLSPDEATAHQNLGSVLARQGRLDEAVPHFAAAVRLQPRSAESYANLGFALSQRGETEEAAQFLAAAVRLDPSLAERDQRLRPYLPAGGDPGG